MSTSRKPALPGPSKKISSWVRPGVCEVRASALRPVSALIRLDLPTLERPANATSMPAIGGSVSIEGEAQKNCQSPANNLRPCSIRSASISAVIRRLPVHRHGRACPGHPRLSFRQYRKTWMPGTRPGMTSWGILATYTPASASPSGLRLGLLRRERRPEIVEQFNLDAIAAHDEALLQHRQRVVPRPVDHQTRGEACEHEGEDQRHPVENHLLGRIRRRRIELHLEPHRDAHDDRPDAEREVVTEQRYRRRIEMQ